MEFEELKQRIIYNMNDYSRRHGVTVDNDYAMMKLFEEVGEFAQAMMIYTDRCKTRKKTDKATAKELVSQEIADVIGFAIVCANELDIDIEEAIIKKWIAKEKHRAPENEDL